MLDVVACAAGALMLYLMATTMLSEVFTEIRLCPIGKFLFIVLLLFCLLCSIDLGDLMVRGVASNVETRYVMEVAILTTALGVWVVKGIEKRKRIYMIYRAHKLGAARKRHAKRAARQSPYSTE